MVIIVNLVLTLVLYFFVVNQHRYFCQTNERYNQTAHWRRVKMLLESSISVRAILMMWGIVFGMSAGVSYVTWQLEVESQIEKDLPD